MQYSFKKKQDFIKYYKNQEDLNFELDNSLNKNCYRNNGERIFSNSENKVGDYFYSSYPCQIMVQGEPYKNNALPSSKIDSLKNYFHTRCNIFDKYFSNDVKYDFDILKHEFNHLNEGDAFFNFISIDIIDSTRRSRILDSETNIKVIKLFLNEVANIIFKFGGYIFKFEGDGLLAYYRETGLSSHIHDSFECAIFIKFFVENGINPFLERKKIPKISFRIAINFGLVSITNFGTENELYGYALNATTKIQKFAKENQIIVGGNSFKLVHPLWKQKLSEFKIDKQILEKEGLYEEMKLFLLDV